MPEQAERPWCLLSEAMGPVAQGGCVKGVCTSTGPDQACDLRHVTFLKNNNDKIFYLKKNT